VALVLAASALANTHTGHQNPDLKVVATLLPNTVKVGGTLKATVRVMNTSTRTRKVGISYQLVGPSSGSGVAMSPIPLKPNASWTQSFTMKASDAGRYKLSIKATDANGASRATATASAS
jgi:hypothetical protein